MSAGPAGYKGQAASEGAPGPGSGVPAGGRPRGTSPRARRARGVCGARRRGVTARAAASQRLASDGEP